MEDRLTPGLYLEMTDAEPDRYAAERVPAVLAQPGAQRATWWENVQPHRTDFPAKVPEFSLLGVYEVDDTFAAPAAVDGITGHHFRRYPRPAQGSLTGRPTVGLSLILISPRSPEGGPALRDWADFVHIRHIAESVVPGITMITPYENVTGGDPRFMHFYEMDTDDPEGAFRAMPKLVEQRLGAAPGTPVWDEWASHPQLRIMYVNSFRRLGYRR